jgi:cytoskeletal protein CcmA (bactofilin family)
MWRNGQSQSTTPSSPSRPVVEPSSAAKPADAGSSVNKAESNSWLPAQMKVKGEISGNEDFLIDGIVQGPISVGQHRLVVGHEGHVTGGLTASRLVIYGKVDGDRSVGTESIEIKKDASVTGHLTTRHIVIEDGAIFKGTIDIGDSKQTDSKADKPITRAVSASA